MCMFVYGSVLIGFGLLLFPVNVFHELIKIKSNQIKEPYDELLHIYPILLSGKLLSPPSHTMVLGLLQAE